VAADPAALGGEECAAAIAVASDGRIAPEELQAQTPLEAAALAVPFAGLDVYLVPWATGGPTVAEWLGIVLELDPPADDADPEFWWALVSAGQVALRDRLERLGDPAFGAFPHEILRPEYHARMAGAIRAGEVGPVALPPVAGSTSHLAVVDQQGSLVTLTQTLLSIWGSGVVAPDSGILLNNGMMWFDPRPGRPNSVAGSKLPLANMCPVLAASRGVPYLAFGASGGRRIMPAAVQILARVGLLGYSLAEAMAAPRLEITERQILADARFGQPFCDVLSRRLGRSVVLRQPILGASPWASPVGLARQEDGSWSGGADPYTMACVLQA
jgi:gamma-glutamyltranspeptidase/glutathione hydrolase